MAGKILFKEWVESVKRKLELDDKLDQAKPTCSTTIAT